MAFIGGNLHDIEASANRLVDSGAQAASSGAETHQAAVALAGAIEEAMARLLSQFEGTADRLSADIVQSHAQLTNAEWQGRSKDNAVVLKEELLAQVNGVLAAAAANLSNERTVFVGRAEAMVAAIQTDFQRVMNEIEVRYTELAAASRRTRENLELADQTIMLG